MLIPQPLATFEGAQLPAERPGLNARASEPHRGPIRPGDREIVIHHEYHFDRVEKRNGLARRVVQVESRDAFFLRHLLIHDSRVKSKKSRAKIWPFRPLPARKSSRGKELGLEKKFGAVSVGAPARFF